MAIKITTSYTNSNTPEYIHSESIVPCIRSFVNLPDACCFGECEVPLPVFADLDNESESRNNDFNKFILEVPSGSTVECTLTNLDSGVDYSITDTTYGPFADVGDIATRPLVWAFVVNWFKVADLISFGNYRITIMVKNSMSTEIFSQKTPCFYLSPYTCANAHDTVRFEVSQSGYNQSGFDWSGMDGLAAFFRPQQLRMYGQIERTPVTVTDYISDTNRDDAHVQTEIHNDYTVTLKFVNNTVYNSLVKDLLLENPITLNGYNAFRPDNYVNIKTSYVDFEIPDQDQKSKQDQVIVQLTDQSKANIKRY